MKKFTIEEVVDWYEKTEPIFQKCNATILLNKLRDILKDHFGPVNKDHACFVYFQLYRNPNIYKFQGWFILDNQHIATIVHNYDLNSKDEMPLRFKIMNDKMKTTLRNIDSFVYQYINPEGIYMIEKILMEIKS